MLIISCLIIDSKTQKHIHSHARARAHTSDQLRMSIFPMVVVYPNFKRSRLWFMLGVVEHRALVRVTCATLDTNLTVFAGRHPARVSLRSPVSPCGPRVGLCRARLRCAPSHDTPHFFDKPSSEQDTETSASSLRRVYSRGLAVLWERQQQRQTTPVR